MKIGNRLLHYSDNLLEKINSVDQTEYLAKWGRSDKPGGLWVSVEGEDDWAHWCESDSFRIGSICHEVVLSFSANLLLLTCCSDIDNFSFHYGIRSLHHVGALIDQIKWDVVAERYQGIVIAPYVVEKRFSDNAFWYSGWDCASGCIWDARAIEEVRCL
jgi:hypothetical protein